MLWWLFLASMISTSTMQGHSPRNSKSYRITAAQVRGGASGRTSASVRALIAPPWHGAGVCCTRTGHAARTRYAGHRRRMRASAWLDVPVHASLAWACGRAGNGLGHINASSGSACRAVGRGVGVHAFANAARSGQRQLVWRRLYAVSDGAAGAHMHGIPVRGKGTCQCCCTVAGGQGALPVNRYWSSLPYLLRSRLVEYCPVCPSDR
jgi:hypothetical protein